MPVLHWKDEYAVGIPTIDEEHHQLVAMINDAHDAIEAGVEEKAAKQLIRDMKEYAVTHFATEELLMRDHDYPGIADHITEHLDFLDRVRGSGKSFSGDNFVPGTVKILAFLADWLVHHILQTDHDLARYLKERDAD